jgi:predicted Zn-dependent protease
VRHLILLLVLASPASFAQAPKAGFWDVEKVSQSAATSVNLRKPGADAPVRSVSTASMKKLVAIKQRIEKEAGFTATFTITDMAMPNPNAFATRNDKGSFVAINLAMLDMLADDDDALAAVIGHEYAHIALNHRDARQQREGLRQGVSTLLGFALGMAGVPMAGTLSNAATNVVSRTFSRDEEREADDKGIRYAAAAGFAPEGGIRAWEQMSRRNSGGSIPFLSTHPASDERIENMRALAATLPRPMPDATISGERP